MPYQLNETQPVAVVVYCSDPRFQEAFQQFISDELHLSAGEYIPIVISGGVAALSEPLKLPKEFKFVRDRIGFFLERFDSIHRIVLINHQDCRHYEFLKETLGGAFLRRFGEMSARQKTDLKSVAESLVHLAAPRVSVEMYYAAIVPGIQKGVAFEKVL